jgi:hypothetical protein
MAMQLWQVGILHSSQSDIPHDDMHSHLQPASLDEPAAFEREGLPLC